MFSESTSILASARGVGSDIWHDYARDPVRFVIVLMATFIRVFDDIYRSQPESFVFAFVTTGFSCGVKGTGFLI